MIGEANTKTLFNKLRFNTVLGDGLPLLFRIPLSVFSITTIQPQKPELTSFVPTSLSQKNARVSLTLE
jgi:hypothetical protein